MDILKENENLKTKIRILNQIGKAFSDVEDTEELLNHVLENTMKLADCDAGTIYLLEKVNGNEKLVFKTSLNNSVRTKLTGESINRDKDTAAGFVSTTGEVLMLNDLEKDYPFTIVKKMPEVDYSIKNMMIVPMRNINKEITGVIQLINKYNNDFNEDDIELLLSIASQLAVTIDRIVTNVKLERNVSLTRTTLISFFNGMKQAMSTIGEDILEEQEKFKEYATYDPLTGLLTRKEGLAFLDKQLEFARFNQVNVVVCFIDVNDLKYVNDTFGHAEGDYLLKTITSTIKNTARENDTLFRYGGDEFILVLYNINKETAKHVWKRMMTNINKINQTNDKPYSLSASIGFAEYDYHVKQSIEELIEEADKEMYFNKMEYKKQRVL